MKTLISTIEKNHAYPPTPAMADAKVDETALLVSTIERSGVAANF